MVQYAAASTAVKELIPGTDIPYTVIRAKRKSYAVKILVDGSVELRVPQRMTNKDIAFVLQKHLNWIISHRQQKQNMPQTTLKDGEYIPFLGEKMLIRPLASGKMRCANGEIFLPEENRKEQLTAFYKQAAKEYLPGRLSLFAQRMGLQYEAVKISSAQKRWGSCSSRKSVNLSYRLMMLPTDCIDYVLVHELCHLVQMNHSPDFYRAVKSVLPDYKIREKKIKNAFVL